jgi:hypothetical protein
MARSTDFPGATITLAGESEDVGDLRVFRNGICCVSCWELSDEELAEIVRTKRVFISVFSGASQPPVYVGAEEQVRSVVIDYGGVWKR